MARNLSTGCLVLCLLKRTIKPSDVIRKVLELVSLPLDLSSLSLCDYSNANLDILCLLPPLCLTCQKARLHRNKQHAVCKTCKPVELKPWHSHHLQHTTQHLCYNMQPILLKRFHHTYTIKQENLCSAGVIKTLLITQGLSQGVEGSLGTSVCPCVCVCEQEGWGGGLQGSGSLCPTAAEARVLRPYDCLPCLSVHATPLSNPLFDNYLLCCLGQG